MLEFILDFAWVLIVLCLMAPQKPVTEPVLNTDRAAVAPDLPAQHLSRAKELSKLAVERAALAMPREAYTVIPVSEFVQAVDRAKRHDLGTMSAAELRQLCREHDISVSSRGRISQAVLEQLATVV